MNRLIMGPPGCETKSKEESQAHGSQSERKKTQAKDVASRLRRNLSQFEDCPLGYPKVAVFMDSDDNFMIYRRFGFLYSRVLLSKQDELRRLEEDLDALDRSDASGQYLLQAQQVVSMSKPAVRDHLSVKNFLELGFEEEGRRVRPLMQGDSEFIYRSEDLVTLRPGRESAWLDAFVERFLKMINCRPIQETRLKTSNSHIRYFTKLRVDRFVTLIISVIMLILLVVPTYALYHVTSKDASSTNTTCIGILLVATLVFSAVLSLFTKAKRHEILGASAA
ncbi:MAG: hypothetical protein Q9216_001732 [Gyalolechia sp. 2 TL-2023]